MTVEGKYGIPVSDSLADQLDYEPDYPIDKKHQDKPNQDQPHQDKEPF